MNTFITRGFIPELVTVLTTAARFQIPFQFWNRWIFAFVDPGWYVLKFRVFDFHVKGKQDVPSRRPKVGFILHAHHVLGKVAEGRINQAVNGNALFTVAFPVL